MLGRIIIHGGLTAITLAGIGLLYAYLAGAWIASQSARPSNSEQATQVTESISGTMPLTLAAGGFLFVALGELLRGLWRSPTPPEP